MDRTTHAEVGGPYANRADAERAIRGGGFDQSPADLVISEQGAADDGDGDGGAEPKTASAPGDAGAMGFHPAQTPQTPASPGPADPGITPLRQPMPDGAVPTRTTKPAQTPGSSSLPADPASPNFSPEGFDSAGPDPQASTAARVAALIREHNPGADEDTVRRVAFRALGYFNPYAEMPNIEDPLANKDPAKVVKDVGKNIWKSIPGKGTGRAEPEPEEESGQQSLFPEPQRESRPYDTPPLEPEEEPEPPSRRIPGQQSLFDDPDEPESDIPDLGRFDELPRRRSAQPMRMT